MRRPLSRFLLEHASTRRAALRGLVGASVAAAGLRGRLARAQDDVEPADLSEPLTLFVGGLDSRREGEPENSDVLMLVRVDVVNRTVRSVSIPRDLWVTIPGFGEDKVNRAYDFGSKTQNGYFKPGAELVKATVSQNFGLELDGVLLTTFGGFETIVDALGGVVVNNPYEVADAEYPTVDYGYKSIYYPAGEQSLTGPQALEFSRTRHQDGDGGRIMRQQIVLRALLERARDPELAEELSGLVTEHRNTVKTDLTRAQQLALALAAPDFENGSVAFATLMPYVFDSVAANGAWIYAGDWAQIPGFVEGVLNGSVDDPSYYDQSGSAPVGVAPQPVSNPGEEAHEVPEGSVELGTADDEDAEEADAEADEEIEPMDS